jgi:uncharacterized protein (TIGR00255 family)
MTGFARSEGVSDGYAWTWEAKSVNGKGLDIRCRLPQGVDEIEVEARRLAQAKLKRGNVTLGLTLRRVDGGTRYRVNRDLLDQLIAVIGEAGAAAERLAPPSLDGLLAVRGVVEPAEEAAGAGDREQLDRALVDSLVEALDGLAAMRGDEGRRVGDALSRMLDAIATLCGDAAATAAMQPAAIRERFAAQVKEFLAGSADLPEERVAQELALMVTKADVREELDRLRSHVGSARDLLKSGGVIGRKLDFLCQEFNREANTLCAKSADIALTNIGLALKAAVEQFREQVQNIE